MPVPYLACMIAAAAAYHLPVRVLPAIQQVEGGYVGAASPNKDGSYDLGLMQVNTRWVAPLSRYTGLTPQVVQVRLITNPCFNISSAAAILRGNLIETHGDMMRAIGNYHSHTVGLNTAYRLKVLQSAMGLSGGAGGGAEAMVIAPHARHPAHHRRVAKGNGRKALVQEAQR